MTNTFESYLKEPYTLTFDQMQSLHSELISEIGNDADALEIYGDLIDAANKYSESRAEWMRLSKKDKMDKDSLRTSRHNSVITHFNMLARYLRMQGKAAAWRDQLGYEEDNPYSRKTIGDFGCYIVFVNSICAR